MKFERLRSLREKRGLSQTEAAERLGMVRSTYSNYEAGNREPDFDTAIKLAEFFEVTIDYLLGTPFTNDQAKNAVMEEYSRLPPEKQKIIDDMIQALLEKRK